jgi:tetratricopeptide (TPR) repeat protein
MSAWASLSSLIKRPAVWIGGILTAGLATFVTTNLLTPVQTFLAEKTAEKACQYRQKPITSGSQFLILVSPLDEDPDGSHTKKVMRALIDEKGFNVVRICDPLNFNLSTASQTATDDVLKQASDLIKERHADLILFGYVSEQGKAIVIYAYNEHGGCDRHPKPMKIEQGVLSDDFTAEEKEKLIEVSLKEIQSACLNQSSMDWPQFAIRMAKMETFLNHFDFSQAKALNFAGSYIQAMRLLYENGQGDAWFSKGEEFAKREINKDHAKDQGTNKALSDIYTEYAILLRKNDQDAASSAFDKAISLDPKNAFAYRARGNAYRAPRKIFA